METEKKVNLMEFDSNPNIGLYMFANDKFAIIGIDANKEKMKAIENVLNVPVYKVSVLSTELVGIFVAGNDDFLVVPAMYEDEMKEFEKICKKHDVKLLVKDFKLNTLGNNLCFGNKTILINHEYPKSFGVELAKETGYKVIELKVPEYHNAGAIATFKNGKYYMSQEVGEKDVKDIVDEIGGIGTINAGSNFVSSGIVGNSNGVLIGSMSTTVEIQNVVEGLDYL
ncbi:MAG: hypothetical protein HRU03_02215 [Nanoarchaeales archaeon]|nr:hypothetical protein [Nanoarchaeales archaeon]